MILMYHKVFPDSPTMWWVDVDTFRRQMLELRDRKVVWLDDYDPTDRNQTVVTFDGVYQNVHEFAAPILAELGYPFELFVTGNYIGLGNDFDTPEPPAVFADAPMLRRMVAMGGRLQWHGNAHVNLAEVRNRTAIEEELTVPESIRAIDPKGFRWFGYPHGTLNETVLDCVRQRFAGAVSCHQGNDHDRHCLNRITVTNDISFRHASVSVIIPCYNYGTYLIEAVESVLRQTLPPQEILISDDASTDDTPLIVGMLASRYGDRIRTHRNERNLGIVEHFNRAVAMTSGEYVCFLGADNRFRSDFLEQTTGLLDRNPDSAIAYTNFALFGPRASLVATQLAAHYPIRSKGDTFYIVEFPEFSAETRRLLLEKTNFIHGSSLFRRSAFEQAGGYVESSIGEDWGLFQRMVKAGWSAIHCGSPLLEYRQHSREQANLRATSEAELNYYREGYRQIKHAYDEIRDSCYWPFIVAFRSIERKIRYLLGDKQ